MLFAAADAAGDEGQSAPLAAQAAPLDRADKELEQVVRAGGIDEVPGIYFVNLSNSLVDGWRQPGFLGYDPDGDSFVPGSTLIWDNLAVSDDNQLIALPDHAGGGLLIDRTRAIVYRWPEALQPLTADDGVLTAGTDIVVFQSTSSTNDGRFLVIDLHPTPTVIAAFDGEPATRGVVAPDGRKVAVAGVRTMVLDIASGDAVTIGDGNDGYSFILRSVPNENAFIQLTATGGKAELVEVAWTTRRWDGDQVAAGTLRALPVAGFHLSPAGERLAWTTLTAAAGDTPRTTVQAVDTTGSSLSFAVAGASTCYESSGGNRWLADASALVIRTADGYVLASDSEPLTPLAIEEPVPSPVSNEVFVRGTQAFTGDGNPIAGVSAPEWVKPWFPAWGADGSEFRVATMMVGRDSICHGDTHDHEHTAGQQGTDSHDMTRRVEFLWGADLDVYVDNPGDCTTQTTGDHSYNATWGYARDLGSCTSSNWKYYLEPYGLDSSFVVGYVSATEYSGSLYQRNGATCTSAVTGQYGITMEMREYSEITGLYRVVGYYRLLHMASVSSVGTFVNDAGVIGQPDSRTWLYTSNAGNCQGDTYLYSSARHVHWWKLAGSGFSAWWPNPATYILYYN